jgi:AraC-like DNA-binding protein
MLHYRELPPSPRLAAHIECYWTICQQGPGPLQRVLPDGCADLLLTQTGSSAALSAVGPMTRYLDHSVPEGTRLFGVRFRPGRWRRALAVPGERIVDSIVPLEDLWGSRAGGLRERLAEAGSLEESARAVEAALSTPEGDEPIDRAVAFLVQAGGCVSMDDLARDAGLSPRQFRRVCLDRTGLTPKFLARVLRFRHAAARVGRNEVASAVALDCGYYDQAHLIRDFREFAGRTPGALADRANSVAAL